jgi:hypothetical protein
VILDAVERGERKRVESLVKEHLVSAREAWSS